MVCDKEITQEEIMETKTEFNLLETGSDGKTYSVRNGFLSIAAAKEHAKHWDSKGTREFKIEQVVTTRQTVDIFEVDEEIR
jgi:hypothetical protein